METNGEEDSRKDREPVAGSEECFPKKDNGCTNTFIWIINALCQSVHSRAQLFKDKKVMKIMLMVCELPLRSHAPKMNTRGPVSGGD